VSRIMLRIAGMAVLLGCAAVALAQTEFSADIVNDKEADKATKVYFGKDKIRFDAISHSADGGGVILNMTTHTMTVIMPKQHMYMEMSPQQMENRGMFDFFRTGDVESACTEWLNLDENKGGTCHKDSHETVNGRETVKYEGVNAKGEHSAVWLDSKLRFPVKWQGKNGGGGLRNIQEGSQPASLFETPAGYTKFDMGNIRDEADPVRFRH
jgi:hypothetical protein